MAEKSKELHNSLTGLVSSLALGSGIGSQIGRIDTIFKNLSFSNISNQRQMLSEMYVEHGIVQTLIDQPVDDGFSKGFEVLTGQLDPDQIGELEKYLIHNHVITEIMYALKWARLFGGGALLILTKQDPATELELDRIHDFSEVQFRGVDRWELYPNKIDAEGTINIRAEVNANDEFFSYYGKRVHKSRVIIVKGKRPPAVIRPRYQGFGMSEIERMIRSFNQYLKNNEVIFELLDEAKIDVYGINGFNEALMNASGTRAVQNRIQAGNQLKNFQNAIVMDVADTYEQKSMAFAGLGDMITQIRQGVAGDLKIPVTKLFGVSSSGFNSGEDDIENYNSMIESEIRTKAIPLIMSVVSIVSKKLFDFIPDDLQIEFEPLRVLSSEQEQTVKMNKLDRILKVYDRGLMTAEEARESINKANLTPSEVEVNNDIYEQNITDPQSLDI